MTPQSKHFVACLSAMAALVIAAYSPSAHACGGFFCNQSQPVNQAAERIIFAQHPDDTVTAIVQVMYEGPSEKFAWILPVPGSPTVDVSSDQALNRLQTATNPSYRLVTTFEGQCASGNRGFTGEQTTAVAQDSSGGAGPDTRDPNAGGVTVVSSGSVGPYNHTTISVDPATPNPEEEALEWLDTNGYDISALAPELLRAYLEDGMNLLAVKLQKQTETGDIRPIRLEYDAELPMIPIKLTAVAANDDMGVLVWVLGQNRSIPANYKSLELNEAAINWLDPGESYDAVVSLAADEAQGQGFVTEYADEVDEPINVSGRSLSLKEAIFGQPTRFRDGEGERWNQLAEQNWAGREGELLQSASQFAGFDGFERVVDDHVPLPDGVSAAEFTDCPTCFDIVRQSDIEGFDPDTFIDQLQQQVIDPMAETQALINSFPYITRLYTTMSPEEMTLDPVFDFNAQLGDHPRVHTAEQIIECSRAYEQTEAPWSVHLPQGDVVYGVAQEWPLDPARGEIPATRRIVQAEPMGDGRVVEDNSTEISDAVEESNRQIRDGVSGGIACSATGNPAMDLSLALVVAGFGLVAVRRRIG